MRRPNYKVIIDHYENCLTKYGDNHRGVDWPNEEDASKRYEIMLNVLSYRRQRDTTSLLDFGCGTAGLYEYLQHHSTSSVSYSGLDVSPKFIEVCKRKFPYLDFYEIDILKGSGKIPAFDFVVMNGVFTEKRELSFDEMLLYFKSMLRIIFKKANIGIAFNVMSKQVDCEREDLFHLPQDLLTDFLVKDISRHYVIRNDYGLYEYTVYVFKTAYHE